MEEFAQGTWDNIVQLGVALTVIAGIVGSIWFLADKSGLLAKIITRRQIRHRLDTCPQKAALEAIKITQDHKIDSLNKQLESANMCNLMLQGSHIVLFCMFAKFRGFLPRYEREWLRNTMTDYENKGGNHGVKDIFEETMLLPESPKVRRKAAERE